MKLQYVEFHSRDLPVAKKFYADAFGWSFTDYGPEYAAFSGGPIEGGFTLGEPKVGSTLVTLYSRDLEASKAAVIHAHGLISKDTFSFPGGRRFHFTDPDGNELAVWSHA